MKEKDGLAVPGDLVVELSRDHSQCILGGSRCDQPIMSPCSQLFADSLKQWKDRSDVPSFGGREILIEDTLQVLG